MLESSKSLSNEQYILFQRLGSETFRIQVHKLEIIRLVNHCVIRSAFELFIYIAYLWDQIKFCN